MKNAKKDSAVEPNRKPTAQTTSKAKARKTASKPKTATRKAASTRDATAPRSPARPRTRTRARGDLSASTQHMPPSRDNIALEAYLIWESEGFPQGQEVAHWLRAEARLRELPAQA